MNGKCFSAQFRCHRRGAAVIIILAVFAVVMILAGVWTRRIIAEHRAHRLAAERVQARWLAEAGVRRAAAQLLRDDDYDGEQWDVSGDELNRSQPASVLIRIEPGDAAGELKLIARARYPAESPRVQITTTVVFTPPSPEPQP